MINQKFIIRSPDASTLVSMTICTGRFRILSDIILSRPQWRFPFLSGHRARTPAGQFPLPGRGRPAGCCCLAAMPRVYEGLQGLPGQSRAGPVPDVLDVLQVLVPAGLVTSAVLPAQSPPTSGRRARTPAGQFPLPGRGCRPPGSAVWRRGYGQLIRQKAVVSL